MPERVIEREKVRIDAQAAAVAAYDRAQKIFLLLLERGVRSVDDAQLILRNSIDAQSGTMDAE